MLWNCFGSPRVPASLFAFAAYCAPSPCGSNQGGVRAVEIRTLLDAVDAQARLADFASRTSELRHTRAHRLLLWNRITVRNRAAGLAARPSVHAVPSSL